MRAVLATIFLLIFSFQVVPVKEIGKLLFKGALTEEIHETEFDNDDADNTGNEVKKGSDPYPPQKLHAHFNKWMVRTGNSLLGVNTPEHVSKQFIPDIPTPPPNEA